MPGTAVDHDLIWNEFTSLCKDKDNNVFLLSILYGYKQFKEAGYRHWRKRVLSDKLPVSFYLNSDKE